MAETVQTFDENRFAGRPALPPSIKQVKLLIWVYFWLIIFEGSLRKWVLPGLSDVLLVIRDPVLLLIYFQAIRGGFFPKHPLVKVTIALGVFTFLWGCIYVVGGDYIRLLITAYGIRTYFLHLPLIFLMGHVLTREDVLKFGRAILYISVPLALLMAVQYTVGDGHWLNRATTGEEGKQLSAAMGKIRPPGFFSFITGPVMFFPIAVAFIIYGVLRLGTYSIWLVLAAAGATALVQPVSGSRSVVLACGLVVAFACISLLFNGRHIGRFIFGAVVIFVIGISVLSTDVGRESVESFTKRWNLAAEHEGQGSGAAKGLQGISARLFGGFTEIFDYLPYVPFYGHGIGAGTNVGIKLLTGDVGVFLFGEHEWTRNVMEAGPIVGFAYIGFRIYLAFFLLRVAWQRMRQGDVLSWMLMACAFTHLVYGQTQQPTILGFMVFSAGLSLASVEVMARHVPMSENQRRRQQQAERIARKRQTSGALTADGGTI